jgi:hypothetical protein
LPLSIIKHTTGHCHHIQARLSSCTQLQQQNIPPKTIATTSSTMNACFGTCNRSPTGVLYNDASRVQHETHTTLTNISHSPGVCSTRCPCRLARPSKTCFMCGCSISRSCNTCAASVCNAYVCNARVCNAYVCNARVCNAYVCNTRVCNAYVCNARVCNAYVCNARVCNVYVYNARVCNAHVCNARVCNAYVCNARVCSAYVSAHNTRQGHFSLTLELQSYTYSNTHVCNTCVIQHTCNAIHICMRYIYAVHL